MNKLWLAIPLLLCLAGCAEEEVLMTKREVVVVKPDPLTYAQCPKDITYTPASDTNTGRDAIMTIYRGYEKCRQTVEDIQREIDRLAKDVTANNKKPD